MLEEQLRLARHRRFGASSETNVLQGDLALDTEAPPGEGEREAVEAAAADELPAPKTKRRRGNKGLSPDLPRVERRHLLSEAERIGAIETFLGRLPDSDFSVPYAYVRIFGAGFAHRRLMRYRPKNQSVGVKSGRSCRTAAHSEITGFDYRPSGACDERR